MRAVLQRVRHARVLVGDEVAGAIGPGLVVLLAVAPNDTLDQVRWLADKTVHLRVFADDDGKMNRSVLETGGAVLVVSQFTLFGDCSKGRRPSFIGAAAPAVAIPLYEAYLDAIRSHGVQVASGKFAADMQVELTNDGPVTLIVDTP